MQDRRKAIDSDTGVRGDRCQGQHFAVAGKPELLKCFNEHNEERNRSRDQQAGFENTLQTGTTSAEQRLGGSDQRGIISPIMKDQTPEPEPAS